MQAVVAGEVSVVAVLEVPEGYKINKEMPVLWSVRDTTDVKVVDLKEPGPYRTTAAGHKVVMRIPVRDGVDAGEFQVTVRYGYCRDGVGGLCRIATKGWVIPVRVTADGAREIDVSTTADVVK